MALVRISKQLILDVEEGIRGFRVKVFEDTIKPLHPEAVDRSVTGGPLYDYALKLVWGEHFHLMSVIPQKWHHTADRIDLKIKDANGLTVIELQVKPKNGKVPCPPNTTQYGNHTGYVARELAHDQRHLVPWVGEFLEKKALYDAANDAHKLKFHNIDQQVTDFLKGSKSLNDAVKKYPDIRLWIPKPYLDEVERVVVRVPRAASEAAAAAMSVAEVDTSLLASMGVYKSISASTG